MPTKPTITTVTSQAQNNAFQVNKATDELADAIATCVAKDGTDAMTGNLNMNSNRVTNLAAGSADSDAARLIDVSDGVLVSTSITDKDEETLAAADYIVFSDTSDSGNLKKALGSDLIDRSNHTGTQAASTISDFDTEVSNNTDVDANTTHRSSDGKNHSDVVLNNTHRTSTGADHTYIDQAVTTTSSPTFNAITVTTTVDGRDVSVDGTKLDGIEAGATADQTGAEIKSLYEGEADTNAYTDAEKTKVGYISVTQAVDLDTMESDIATNNAKVTNATHSGDVTGATTLTIANDAVTYAKMQNVAADQVLLGNDSGAGSAVQELTATEVRTLINVENGADVTDYTKAEVNHFYTSTNITESGTTYIKSGGTAGFNEQVYSINSYTGGAHIILQAGQVNSNVVVGLNTDPTTDAGYLGIDYGLNLVSDGTLYIIESGVSAGSYGAYTTTTILEVIYNGNDITYYMDGSLIRTVSSIGTGIKFYFDSSFSGVGAKITNVRFEQFVDNAAIVLNTAKVTNATHTGDVTGDTVLTIAAGAIDIAMHSATGTPSSSTFYCGDNTWTALPTAGTIQDTAYTRAGWDGDTTNTATKNAMSDAFYNMVRYDDADTGGTDSLFIGPTGNTTNSGNYNTIAGHLAGGSITTGYDITALGYNAGAGLTSENSIVCIGESAGYSAATRSICIGESAGYACGSECVFIGVLSGESVIAGMNTCVGYKSLQASTYSGTQYNVAIGYLALSQGTSVNTCTAVGAYALYNHNAGLGGESVAVGHKAGYNAYTGKGNVFLGNEAGPTIGFSSIANSLYINNAESNTPLIYGDFANNYVEIHDDLITNATVGGRTLTVNGQITMYPTSNTNMRIAYKGTDGTVRTGDITLA